MDMLQTVSMATVLWIGYVLISVTDRTFKNLEITLKLREEPWVFPSAPSLADPSSFGERVDEFLRHAGHRPAG